MPSKTPSPTIKKRGRKKMTDEEKAEAKRKRDALKPPKEKKAPKKREPKKKPEKKAEPKSKNSKMHMRIHNLFTTNYEVKKHNLQIARNTIILLEDLMNDMLGRLSARAFEHVVNLKEASLKARHVRGAVAIILPGKFGDDIDEYATNAVDKFKDTNDGLILPEEAIIKILETNPPLSKATGKKKDPIDVENKAGIYTTAVLQTLLSQYIQAGVEQRDDKTLITPNHIMYGIRLERDCNTAMCGAVVVLGDHYKNSDAEKAKKAAVKAAKMAA